MIRLKMHGAREVEHAFREVEVRTDRQLADEMKKLAEPIQKDAEARALAAMSNIASGRADWSRMKLGRRRLNIYIAEKQKSRGGPGRGNVLPTLMDQALRPAVNSGKGDVVRGMEKTLEHIINQVF